MSGARARRLREQRQRERAAERRRGDEHAQRVGRQPRQAASHEIRHARRQRERGRNRPLPRRAGVMEDVLFRHRAHELHDQERVALGVPQHEVEQVLAEIRAVQRALQPLAHFGGGQALEAKLAHALVAREPLAALAHRAVRRLLAANRERDADPLRRELREHVLERIPARDVAPVHVLEHDEQRSRFARSAQVRNQLAEELMALQRIQRSFD